MLGTACNKLNYIDKQQEKKGTNLDVYQNGEKTVDIIHCLIFTSKQA